MGMLMLLREDKMILFNGDMSKSKKDNEKPKVHYHFVPRYKNELKLFGKAYKDRHFGYNFWKWNLSKFKCQKDPYTQEERLKMFEMMKEEQIPKSNVMHYAMVRKPKDM